ncbi:MAG: extracellular solute-binding protein [Paenibacillaceae bacterium]|nr:extracellular solute-binding protein [Paenibacillaceae bacterium]
MGKSTWKVVLAGVLAAGTIGCSEQSGGTNPNKAADGTKADSSASAKPADKKEPPKVYVYAGAPANPSKAADLELVRKEIIAKSGIEIVPIIAPVSQYEEKLNLLLASNESPDLFPGASDVYRIKGATQPITGLLDQYGSNIRKLWPKDWANAWPAVSDDKGQIWGVPIIPALAEKTAMIRTDWLKKVNLPMPTTMDEFENVLKAFKEKDPAGKGQTIPLLVDLIGLNLGLSAGFMDVGYGNWLDKDGKIKPAELHPGYKQFVAKMAEWYQKGYIYKETFTINWDRMKELIKQNRVAATALHVTVVTNPQAALQTTVPEAKYEVPPALKGSQGNVRTMQGYSTLLSKTARDPQAAVKLLDWIHADIENYFLLMYGIKDKHWRYIDQTNHIVERINQDYAGEFLTGSSFAYTVQFSSSDPAVKPEIEYYNKYVANPATSKAEFTSGVSYKFDQKAIADKLPNREDISRMINEEVTKFIMGARPMADYDKFVQDLYAAGLDKWIDVYTEQYNKAKSSGQ